MASNGSNTPVDPDALLIAVRACFTYPPGERRATGYLYGDVDWPPALEPVGGELLSQFGGELVVFQAYADGSATCPEHSDSMEQTIVSLGATRTLAIDGRVREARHGDVITLAPYTPHAVLPDPSVTDERISLVFRAR